MTMPTLGFVPHVLGKLVVAPQEGKVVGGSVWELVEVRAEGGGGSGTAFLPL